MPASEVAAGIRKAIALSIQFPELDVTDLLHPAVMKMQVVGRGMGTAWRGHVGLSVL